MSAVSDAVGQHITWHYEAPGEVERHVSGVVVAARPSGSVMTDELGRWRGVQFLIKPDDGSGSVWTCTFADHDAPAEVGS